MRGSPTNLQSQPAFNMQQSTPEPSSHGPARKIAIQKLAPHRSTDMPERYDKEERVSSESVQNLSQAEYIALQFGIQLLSLMSLRSDTPRCANCERGNLVCVYDPARRDRLGEAMRLNQTLVNLLKDLEGRVDEADKKVIQEALQDVEDETASLGSFPSTKTLGKRPYEQSSTRKGQEDTDHGEAFVTASVGSNEDLDFLDEDLMRNRGARETGYIGQNSEVQWLRSVQRQAGRGNTDPHGQRYGPPGASLRAINERSEALHERRQNSRPGSMCHVTDSTFYLDSDDIEIDIAVDPYETPNPEIAEKLFDCYIDTVHSTFPLMPADFEGQFRRYIQSTRSQRPYHVPPKWRATMNLLFAIGAKYSHLTGAEWRGDERDHLIYMTRAVQLLGLKDTMAFIAAPSLDRVQATGALAFYFLVIGHVSRAWIMIGFSIRLALALGLHLRNEDPSLDDARREPLVRTWWCLHSIECLVSSITGRPPVIANEDCTVPHPQTMARASDEDSSASQQTSRIRTRYSPPQNTSSNSSESGRQGTGGNHYFVTYINLSLISQKVLLNLYSPRTATQSWEYIQTRITQLLNELDEWSKSALPLEDIRTSGWSHRPDHSRERFLLKIYYWSTMILITRPCLCRIERRIESESGRSVDFNRKTAETCVHAAREMTRLLPDQPDTGFIYSQGPWWDVVHNIMQAMAVLLLEMAYEGKHLADEKADIITCIKKMMRWLRAMQVSDPVAARAYGVVYKILNTCAPALRAQVKELIADDQDQGHQSSYPRNSMLPSQSELWNASDDTGFSQEASQSFVPPPLQQQYMDPLYPSHVPEFQSTSFAFGNPFVTNFDQGMPLVDMQNLCLKLLE
ncbi:fungal specific transcription factor domain-containing [Pyrenophora seminiperda CCB06]|uniref:Fungal specific transcription factor domain-containing n=1 Tax=Pyrenophora seminiperda CCB06 TaxID=1302712 RepID=A0A3M7M4T1_9PLEO|nr:fungal specific transcription factor domain-containing [Pyrenophora seminiperda CCB06]